MEVWIGLPQTAGHRHYSSQTCNLWGLELLKNFIQGLMILINRLIMNALCAFLELIAILAKLGNILRFGSGQMLQCSCKRVAHKVTCLHMKLLNPPPVGVTPNIPNFIIALQGATSPARRRRRHRHHSLPPTASSENQHPSLHTAWPSVVGFKWATCRARGHLYQRLQMNICTRWIKDWTTVRRRTSLT